MRSRLSGLLFALLVSLLIRRGLTPDQAHVTAEQMTKTPLRYLWRRRRWTGR